LKALKLVIWDFTGVKDKREFLGKYVGARSVSIAVNGEAKTEGRGTQ
jgi:hypothetical protein